MESRIEVLFFLDNPDAALIEVGSSAWQNQPDAINTSWYIYHKSAGLVKRFRFITSLWAIRPKERFEGGVLKIIQPKGSYSIAIGIKILDFKERPPQMLTQSALRKIEEYVSRL